MKDQRKVSRTSDVVFSRDAVSSLVNLFVEETKKLEVAVQIVGTISFLWWEISGKSWWALQRFFLEKIWQKLSHSTNPINYYFFCSPLPCQNFEKKCQISPMLHSLTFSLKFICYNFFSLPPRPQFNLKRPENSFPFLHEV